MKTFDQAPNPDQLRAAEQQAIQLFTASRKPQKITYGDNQSYIPDGFAAYPITAEDIEKADADQSAAQRLRLVLGENELSHQLPDDPRIIITRDDKNDLRSWNVRTTNPTKLQFLSARRDGVLRRKGAIGGNYRNQEGVYQEKGSVICIPATRERTNVEADVLFTPNLIRQGRQQLWVLLPQQKQVEKIVQPQSETTAGIYSPGSWQVRKGLYEKEYFIAGKRAIVLSEEGDATISGKDSRHFVVNGQPVNEDRAEVLEKAGANREVNEVDVIMADGATDAGEGTGWDTATAAVSNYIEAKKGNSSFENAVSASAKGVVQQRKDLFSQGYKYGAAAVTCVHAARNADGSWNVESANQGTNRVFVLIFVLINGRLHDLEKESNILTQALVGQVLFKGSEDQQTEIQLLDAIKVPQRSVIITYTDGNLEQDHQREVPDHIVQIAQMVAQKKTPLEIKKVLKQYPKGKDDRTFAAVFLD